MKTCHVCNCLCEDNAELCPICGADLSEILTDTNEELADDKGIKNPVLLATLEDVVSVEILCDILNESGIPNFSEDTDGGSIHTLFGSGFFAFEVYVDKQDFDKARQLYEDFLQNEPEFEDGFSEEEI